MDLKLKEHIRNTISLLYKQKPGEIPIFGIFLAKNSILAYILLKINIFRSVMFYYVIVTSYVDRFLWFWYQGKEKTLFYTMVPNNYTLGMSISKSQGVVITPLRKMCYQKKKKKVEEDEGWVITVTVYQWPDQLHFYNLFFLTWIQSFKCSLNHWSWTALSGFLCVRYIPDVWEQNQYLHYSLKVSSHSMHYTAVIIYQLLSSKSRPSSSSNELNFIAMLKCKHKVSSVQFSAVWQRNASINGPLDDSNWLDLILQDLTGVLTT